jgi:hypothetical protein
VEKRQMQQKTFEQHLINMMGFNVLQRKSPSLPGRLRKPMDKFDQRNKGQGKVELKARSVLLSGLAMSEP